MKAQANISERSVERTGISMPAPALPPPADARVAANDELASRKNDTAENPLWAINIAMAVFFIVAALVMMTS